MPDKLMSPIAKLPARQAGEFHDACGSRIRANCTAAREVDPSLGGESGIISEPFRYRASTSTVLRDFASFGMPGSPLVRKAHSRDALFH